VTSGAKDARIKVLCVDDDADVADVLSRAIDAEPDMESVGFLPSTDHLLAAVRDRRPGIILLDLNLPGPDALDSMAEAAREYPRSRSVVLTSRDAPGLAERIMDAGGWGLVHKQHGPAVVFTAIRAVAEGRLHFGGVPPHRGAR